MQLITKILLFLLFTLLLAYVFNNHVECFEEPKKIGIIVIATNAYFLLGLKFIKQWLYYCDDKNKYKFYFFSDKNILDYLPTHINNVEFIQTTHGTWMDATNSKFTNILSLQNKLQNECSHVFYFDADSSISKKFTDKWFMIGDLVGEEHFNNRTTAKAYDRNPLSAAYIPHDTPYNQIYYHAAFFGGSVDKVMNMCKVLIENQKRDKIINYEPVWNDESYVNHYFHYNPPSLVTNEAYEFNISDKGGSEGDTRKIDNDWQNKYIGKMKEHVDDVFDFNNGDIRVIGKLEKN